MENRFEISLKLKPTEDERVFIVSILNGQFKDIQIANVPCAIYTSNDIPMQNCYEQLVKLINNNISFYEYFTSYSEKLKEMFKIPESEDKKWFYCNLEDEYSSMLYDGARPASLTAEKFQETYLCYLKDIKAEKFMEKENISIYYSREFQDTKMIIGSFHIVGPYIGQIRKEEWFIDLSELSPKPNIKMVDGIINDMATKALYEVHFNTKDFVNRYKDIDFHLEDASIEYDTSYFNILDWNREASIINNKANHIRVASDFTNGIITLSYKYFTKEIPLSKDFSMDSLVYEKAKFYDEISHKDIDLIDKQVLEQYKGLSLVLTNVLSNRYECSDLVINTAIEQLYNELVELKEINLKIIAIEPIFNENELLNFIPVKYRIKLSYTNEYGIKNFDTILHDLNQLPRTLYNIKKSKLPKTKPTADTAN